MIDINKNQVIEIEGGDLKYRIKSNVALVVQQYGNAKVEVILGKNSRLDYFAFAECDLKVVLGEGAQFNGRGFYYLGKGEKVTSCFSQLHEGTKTLGNMLVYAFLSGGASFNCFNSVLIKDKSHVEICNKSWLLDKEAEIKIIPKVSISNKDAVCKHNNVVGKIDKKYFFYLQTRGIMYDKSKRIFVRSILSELGVEYEAVKKRFSYL